MLHDKKANEMRYLVFSILFVIIAFVVIIFVLQTFASQANIDSALNICRGSLALNEHSEIGGNVIGMDLSHKLAPLLCKTLDLGTIPEDKYLEWGKDNDLEGSENVIAKNIADRVADCWWEFGEGAVEKDVFNKKFMTKDRCFVCFTFSVDEEYDTLDKEELYDFMSTNAYTAIADDKPYCTEEIVDDCIDKDQSECERKGGVCQAYEPPLYFTRYNSWSCDRGEDCYVDRKNMITYMDYIYFNMGPGIVSVHDDIAEFNSSEVYVVAFISQTTEFAWTVAEIASYFIPAGNIAGLVGKGAAKGLMAIGVRLEAAALKRGIPKMAKLVYEGVGSTAGHLDELGAIVARIEKKSIGNIPAGKIGTRAVFHAAPIEGVQWSTEEINEMFKGSAQILMVAPLNEVNNICSVQDEVGQKS